MDTEFEQRQEAVRRVLAGESVRSISESLNHSQRWVQYWLKRYRPDDVVGSLSNRSRRPTTPYSKWDTAVRQMVLSSRALRQTQAYTLKGAEAIHYELRALGLKPVPPVRTIHAWLKQAGYITASTDSSVAAPAAAYPLPVREQVNDLHEIDLKGPVYLEGERHKYYLVALRDFVSKRVALDALTSRQSEAIVGFLVAAWRKLGLPRTLQLDNGMEFRGSNRYPRSFGKVVRLAVQIEVETRFIPPRQPWRNGLIERLNGQLSTFVLHAQRYASFDALRQALSDCETAINTGHRLRALDGATPFEFAQTAPLRPLPDAFTFDGDFPLTRGSVAFVRRVNRNGQIRLHANDRFDLDPGLHGSYVLARVQFEPRQLDVFSVDDHLLKSFDF
jgi:transposase InsO family protein